MKRQMYIEKISHQLNLLAFEIDNDNLLNLTDKNIYCENFFANLFNTLFDYNLKNANLLTSNNNAIDLIDDSNKICIQVTSNKTTEKIRDTLKKFKENNYDKIYKKLLIIVIARKKYATQFGDTLYFTQKDNIFTIEEILKHINSIVDLYKLESIYDIIKDELIIMEPNNYIVLNEVETILQIINFISGKEDYNPYESAEPDPKKKIYTRFKAYSKQITNQFITYTKLYKSLYNEIYKNLSQAKVTKVSLYLMRESVRELNLVGNPMQAIDNMVENFKKEFAKKNLNIDEGALYYFLYKQVIICNVFPNEEE